MHKTDTRLKSTLRQLHKFMTFLNKKAGNPGLLFPALFIYITDFFRVPDFEPRPPRIPDARARSPELSLGFRNSRLFSGLSASLLSSRKLNSILFKLRSCFCNVGAAKHQPQIEPCPGCAQEDSIGHFFAKMSKIFSTTKQVSATTPRGR